MYGGANFVQVALDCFLGLKLVFFVGYVHRSTLKDKEGHRRTSTYTCGNLRKHLPFLFTVVRVVFLVEALIHLQVASLRVSCRLPASPRVSTRLATSLCVPTSTSRITHTKKDKINKT